MNHRKLLETFYRKLQSSVVYKQKQLCLQEEVIMHVEELDLVLFERGRLLQQ